MVQVKVGLPSSASQLSQVTAAQKNGKAHLVELNTHSRTHLPKVPHSVVHAITGRIRLQVPRLRYDPGYAQRLQYCP
ncbi:MAG: hypothetical protein IGS49_29285 [Chlorogloeopsis fritschii C42_A2020_084]|uniref:hypothetical protein n=1 Tax=Chlorogloeopsis fritschii TaxID=1124 RepID=UPI0019E251B8|nr:hypothetical protein [Chlorogloeopsis fritschii]MBF2009411.1 hypothetical protein [Chlorogloeopsis fritschii C42_A2020_084]